VTGERVGQVVRGEARLALLAVGDDSLAGHLQGKFVLTV
jgi:hypothetical protein